MIVSRSWPSCAFLNNWFACLSWPRVGTQIGSSNLRKLFQVLLTKAKLKRIRFHDLRHTYVTLLIQQGESLAYVRDQLGHHSIQITVDTYGHLVPGSNRSAVDRLDEADEDVSLETGHKSVTTQPEKL